MVVRWRASLLFILFEPNVFWIEGGHLVWMVVAGWRLAYSRGLAAQQLQLSAPEHTGLGQLGFQWVAEWSSYTIKCHSFLPYYLYLCFSDVIIDNN